jgi:hypothetical protein
MLGVDKTAADMSPMKDFTPSKMRKINYKEWIEESEDLCK